MEQLMLANPLMQGQEDKHQRLKRINNEEIQTMKGLLVINYILLHMLFCMLLQIDMV